VDGYLFYRDVFKDAVSRQQVQWPHVFHLEDLGEEGQVCMQGADNHGQSSAGSA
jgi:hypothetical protein